MMIIRNIRHTLTLLLLMICFSSCIYDKEDAEPEYKPNVEAKILSLNVAIPQMIRTEAAGGNQQYEAGVDYENYVDLSNNGLRIYIFDSQNKFVTRLIPLERINVDKTENIEKYTVSGVLPEGFPTTANIKVAVLANWPVYNDDLIPGVSTIDDLCTAEWSKYSRLTDFRLSENNKIPFFGIREYNGLTLQPGNTTVLPGNITLLRAMAKVEVILDNKDVSLTDVTIRGINSKGYCAPFGVYSHTDYDHNGQWDLDYVKTPHLPGNFNDSGPETKIATLFCKNRSSETQKESWVCYVPEYKNTNNSDGSTNYKSRLELKFNYQDSSDKPLDVYFVEYDVNGKPVTGTDYDITRNNCYRFTVSLSQGRLYIKVTQWENAYDNVFTFE